MVKLVGNDTIEEIKLYYDYENNFPQLLEDYLESGVVQAILNKSPSNDRSKQIRNMKHQIKILYEKGDHDKPRMKQFKTWMDNKYEQRLMKYKKQDKDLEKDELIRTLQESIIEKDKTITNLKNETHQHRKKINKLKKKIKDMELKPEPEPSPEPSTELLKRMDPYYDSDDDIVEKVSPPVSPPASEPSIYPTAKQEEDEYEQQLKKQCEAIAIQKEEDSKQEEKLNKILHTYYCECDMNIDKMEKKFKKEVKLGDRKNKNIKNDYINSLEDILYELQGEYLENHDEFEELSKDKKLKMITRPLQLFEDLLPSEMMPIQSIN